MSQGRLAIEATGTTLDLERGWICDPLNPMFGTSEPGISQPNVGMERMMALPPSVGSTEQASGVRFLCFSPRVVPFTTNRIASGRFVQERICLLMTDSTELV